MFASSASSFLNLPSTKERKLPIFTGAEPALAPSALAPSAPATGGGHLLDQLAGAGTVFDVEKGGEIAGQGDEARYCFQVVEGCARSVRRLEDGRRQVSDFLLPGDIFGLNSIDRHEFAAEAVTAVTIRRLNLLTVELRAEEDPGFSQRLRRHVTLQAKAMRNRLVVLGRMTAAERIASFLLEMNERLGSTGRGVVDLPMCRGDMADYLGLTIETVSRCLTDLKRSGAIAVKGARIAIHDRRALAARETLH